MFRVNSQPQPSRPAYSTESSRAPSPTGRESAPPPAQGHFQATPPASGASTPAPLRQQTVYQDQFGTAHLHPTGAPIGQTYAAAPGGQPYGAAPGGQAYGAAPGGQTYAAAPGGQTYAAAPGGQAHAGSPFPAQPAMGAHPMTHAQAQAGAFTPAAPQGDVGAAYPHAWAPSAQAPAASLSPGAPPPAAPYGGYSAGASAGFATTAGSLWGAFKAGVAQGKAQTMAQRQGHPQQPSYGHAPYGAAAYAQPQPPNFASAQGPFAAAGAPSGPSAFAPPSAGPMPGAQTGAREQPAPQHAAQAQPQQVGQPLASPAAPHGSAAQTFAPAPQASAHAFAHPAESQAAEFAQNRPAYGAQAGAFGPPPAQYAPQPFSAGFAPQAQGAYGAPVYATQQLPPLTAEQAQHLQTMRGALLHHRSLIQAARKRTNWAGGAEAADAISGSLITEAASAGVAHWSNQAIDQFQKSQTYVRQLLEWTRSQGLISSAELNSTTVKVPDWLDLGAKLLLGVDLSLFSLMGQGFNAYNLSQANAQTKKLIREINFRLGWPQNAGLEKPPARR